MYQCMVSIDAHEHATCPMSVHLSSVICVHGSHNGEWKGKQTSRAQRPSFCGKWGDVQ